MSVGFQFVSPQLEQKIFGRALLHTTLHVQPTRDEFHRIFDLSACPRLRGYVEAFAGRVSEISERLVRSSIFVTKHFENLRHSPILLHVFPVRTRT